MLTKQDVQAIQRMIGNAVRKGMQEHNPEQIDNVRRDFFTYESEALALAPAASANDIINIEADSDFILQKLTFEADIAAATQTDSTRVVPLVTVQLIDSGSGRQMMQNPIPIPSIFGTGQLPLILPNPRKFLRNTTIQVAYTNFSAATTYNVRLAFIGYKIYNVQ